VPEDIITIAGLQIVMLIASFVQGAVGFAFGMIAMGLSTHLLDARMANILISPLAGLNIGLTLWSVRKDIHIRNFAPMLAGQVIGLPFGLSILLYVSPEMLRLLVAVLLIYVGLSRLYHRNRGRKPLRRIWGLFAGFAGGILGGAANISGPPLIAYAARQTWEPRVFKASLLMIFIVSVALKSSFLAIEGSLTPKIAMTAATLTPAILAGSWLGIQLFNRIDRDRFGLIVAVSVLTLGVSLLF